MQAAAFARSARIGKGAAARLIVHYRESSDVPGTSKRCADRIDCVSAEDLVIRLEQLAQGGLMDLHLEASHTDCPVADNTVALRTLVEDLDSGNSGRGDGVQVDRHFERRDRYSHIDRKQFDPRSTGGN